MSAATKAKAWTSGFCAPGLPPDSHKRCVDHPRADSKPCACACHVVTVAPVDDGPEPGIPGFHDNIPERDYHAHAGSLSVTGAKVILKAPALFKYQREHPVHKTVFDFGSAAHKLVLGAGPNLIVHEYDAEKVKSPKATNAWKAEQAAARKVGDILLTPDEHAAVTAMADELASHRMAMRLLSDGQPEVSAFGLDERTGVLRRSRFDWLGATILSDYKTSVSSDPDAFVRTAVNLDYHMQAAWYADLAADLGHPSEAFAFIVQEKDPPHLVTVIELPADLVAVGRARNRRALERFRDCTESGLWPGYIPDDQFATPAAPAWALREDNAA